MLLLPLMPALEAKRATWTSGVLLVLAIGIALWVLLDPVAPSAALYSDFK